MAAFKAHFSSKLRAKSSLPYSMSLLAQEAAAYLTNYFSGQLNPNSGIGGIYFWRCSKTLSELASCLVPSGFKAILDGRRPDLAALSSLSEVREQPDVSFVLCSKAAISKRASMTLQKRYLQVTYNGKTGRWTLWYDSSQPMVLLVEYKGVIPLPPTDIFACTLRALSNRDMNNVKVLFGNNGKILWGHRLAGIGFGWTWLHFVISIRYVQAVEFIISNQPELLNAESSGTRSSPLHQAAYRGYCEIISLLYARGAQLTTVTNPGLYYAVHNACHRGHREATRLILNCMKEKGYFEARYAPAFIVLKPPSKWVRPTMGIIIEWFEENYSSRRDEWFFYIN